jgi:hypothetical protein
MATDISHDHGDLTASNLASIDLGVLSVDCFLQLILVLFYKHYVTSTILKD